jgi:chromosome segregation ATPase
MALIDKTLKYEIKVCYSDDGVPRGAHLIRRRYIELDGEVISNSLLAAEPVNLSDLSEVMTQAQADALARVELQDQEIAALSQSVEDRDDAIAAAENAHAAKVSGLGAEIEELRAALADRDAEITSLRSALAGPQAEQPT